jgi:hypothetical protein
MAGGGTGTPSAPATEGESRTIPEIGEDVLREIGELAAGQTAKDYDIVLCTRKYGQVYQELQAPELLATWDENDPIPAVAVDSIVALVAEKVTSIFGVRGQTLADVQAKAAGALSRLRENIHVNYVAAITEEEYF